jgi:hypothetical protein
MTVTVYGHMNDNVYFINYLPLPGEGESIWEGGITRGNFYCFQYFPMEGVMSELKQWAQ